MRFYLSSYKLGNEVDKLKKMIPKNKKTAYIANAMDYSQDMERIKEKINENMQQLSGLGLDVELLDLKEYFGKSKELENKLSQIGTIFISGGNVFVLRQAMKLSGFDIILKKFIKENREMLYGGYSAGICVLAQNLKGIDLMDDLTVKPYGNKLNIIWEGLGILDYLIVPHFKSDHPETKLADKAVEYLKKNKMPFKTLRDGEVIII